MGLKASGELLRGSRFLVPGAETICGASVLIPPSGSDSLHGTQSSQHTSTHNMRSFTLLVHFLVRVTGRQMYSVYCYKDLF